MATRNSKKALVIASVAVGLITGCTTQAPLTRQDQVIAYCQKQGSELAVWQCEQYYTRATQAYPPQPIPNTNWAGQSEMDHETRAAVIGALLSRSQTQPYVLPTYQIPVNRPWTANCLRMGDYTTCNGN